MASDNKEKTIIARVTAHQHDKLMKLIGKNSVSQWVRDRIDRAKIKEAK